MISPRLVPILVGATIAALLLSGCGPVGHDGDTAATPAFPSRPSKTPVAVPPVAAPVPAVGTAATAITPRSCVYVTPGGALEPSLAGPRPSGAPLTFLVVQSIDGWLEVNLRDRPNGAGVGSTRRRSASTASNTIFVSPRNRTP